MRIASVPGAWLALGSAVASALITFSAPLKALDAPTGAPLFISSIETEQPVPLAVLSPDGKTATCSLVRLHWDPQPSTRADEDATSFTLDIAPEKPGATVFTAQLWSASLASALAWQQPWEGAHWKVFETPASDGTGIDAALAVGMISTSARRPYPKTTLVLGSLKPDGTLGAVTRIGERLDAAAAAGITRVIIPNIQRFDVDATGQVLNVVRHAQDLHLDCVSVDNLVQATEQVMHDPLPPVTLSTEAPKYGPDVADYISDYARREQEEMTSGLVFAPKEAEMKGYPARTAAIWKSVYADAADGQQALRAGQVYTAYRLFAHANGQMHGVNALSGQTRISFDVRQTLADSDDLLGRVHQLMDVPTVDQDNLESAVLVAEMSDWAFDLSAALGGAQVVTKQAFSVRTDATPAEKDRAREAILFANGQARYLLDGAAFYTGLISHVTKSQVAVGTNAENLLPQLIPAQLATAEIFTEGIRSRANALRDGLLFDPRLVAYVNVLRETKAAWETRRHKKEVDSAAHPEAAKDAPAATKLNASATGNVGFDPGNTYLPPRNVLVEDSTSKKLSDVAACLIWVNNDCEIATLDEKYLHLGGSIDATTHAWHLADRAKLDELLQSAENGARLGITFAQKAEVDTSVLAMIYERASQLRLQKDNASGLEGLRNYWRCALLGNMCWQLAHVRKAEPVALSDEKDTKGKEKGKKTTAKDKSEKADEAEKTAKADTEATPEAGGKDPKPTSDTTTNTDQLVVAPPAEAPGVLTAAPTEGMGDSAAAEPPIAAAAPADSETEGARKALPVTDDQGAPAAATEVHQNTPAPASIPAPAADAHANPAATSPATNTASATSPVVVPADDLNIPVAPIARTGDLGTGDVAAPATTNAPPENGAPVPAPADKNATGE